MIKCEECSHYKNHIDTSKCKKQQITITGKSETYRQNILRTECPLLHCCITKCDRLPKKKNYGSIILNQNGRFHVEFPIPEDLYPCITCESLKITLRYDAINDWVNPVFRCKEDLLERRFKR